MTKIFDRHFNGKEEGNELELDALPLKKAALILRAGDHQLRQQILQLLHWHGRITATAVNRELQLPQSLASQHLSILRKAGLVTTEKEGKHIYYSVNYNRLKEVQQFTLGLLR